MRNVVMLAVAAGLVLPTAAQAQRGPESRQPARAEAQADARAERIRLRNETDADLAAWNARNGNQQAQQRRENRREVRQDARREARQDIRREARQDARREIRQDIRRDARQNAYRDAYRDARQDARQDYRRDARQARRNYRDWRAYRQAERNAFRRGSYYAPRGYSYRRVGVGQRLLTSLFWGQSYWINPYDYYLPQPRYGFQRWIRYGNDVLLIDTRNGRVLVVYDNFFW